MYFIFNFKFYITILIWYYFFKRCRGIIFFRSI